jgi:hypothetical protein
MLRSRNPVEYLNQANKEHTERALTFRFRKSRFMGVHRYSFLQYGAKASAKMRIAFDA